jgi:hypothetical protein
MDDFNLQFTESRKVVPGKYGKQFMMSFPRRYFSQTCSAAAYITIPLRAV